MALITKSVLGFIYTHSFIQTLLSAYYVPSTLMLCFTWRKIHTNIYWMVLSILRTIQHRQGEKGMLEVKYYFILPLECSEKASISLKKDAWAGKVLKQTTQISKWKVFLADKTTAKCKSQEAGALLFKLNEGQKC